MQKLLIMAHCSVDSCDRSIGSDHRDNYDRRRVWSYPDRAAVSDED